MSSTPPHSRTLETSDAFNPMLYLQEYVNLGLELLEDHEMGGSKGVGAAWTAVCRVHNDSSAIVVKLHAADKVLQRQEIFAVGGCHQRHKPAKQR